MGCMIFGRTLSMDADERQGLVVSLSSLLNHKFVSNLFAFAERVRLEAESPDGYEDFVGGPDPLVGLRLLVVRVDEGHATVGQRLRRLVHSDMRLEKPALLVAQHHFHRLASQRTASCGCHPQT